MSTKLNRKELALEPVSLGIDRSVIIDSINLNNSSWQTDKTIEELVNLQNVLILDKKKQVANEHVCEAVANVYVQLAIYAELYGIPNIQKFINDKLQSIRNRNRREKKRSRNIGFTITK